MSDQTGYNELYRDFVSHQHDVDQSKDVVLEVSGPTFAEGCLELCRSIKQLADEIERREALHALADEVFADQMDDAREPWGEDDGNDRYSN
jgi:hypothetical protein